ncbi:MAG: hypothetical protein QM715_07370 [Nibricoccus sp.]
MISSLFQLEVVSADSQIWQGVRADGDVVTVIAKNQPHGAEGTFQAAGGKIVVSSGVRHEVEWVDALKADFNSDFF